MGGVHSQYQPPLVVLNLNLVYITHAYVVVIGAIACQDKFSVRLITECPVAISH